MYSLEYVIFWSLYYMPLNAMKMHVAGVQRLVGFVQEQA